MIQSKYYRLVLALFAAGILLSACGKEDAPKMADQTEGAVQMKAKVVYYALPG